VNFTAITLCVASQCVLPNISVYFVIDSVRKLLDTPSCIVHLKKYFFLAIGGGFGILRDEKTAWNQRDSKPLLQVLLFKDADRFRLGEPKCSILFSGLTGSYLSSTY
jgi:hypothetical protein